MAGDSHGAIRAWRIPTVHKNESQSRFGRSQVQSCNYMYKNYKYCFWDVKLALSVSKTTCLLSLLCLSMCVNPATRSSRGKLKSGEHSFTWFYARIRVFENISHKSHSCAVEIAPNAFTLQS